MAQPNPIIVADKTSLASLRHDLWWKGWRDWYKWRKTYEGGRCFIDEYLQKFSEREDGDDFAKRKAITYCPAFAKAAINEVKEAIFERMCDVVRRGGSSDYQSAVSGNVDRKGNNMNTFIAQHVLPELLTMSKVGIYVDMPELDDGASINDVLGKRPYVYHYTAEQILTWQRDKNNVLNSILLQDCYDEYDAQTGLPLTRAEQYRLLYLENGKVVVRLYDEKGTIKGSEKTLDIPEIPIVILEINDSLLADVADYQIALLNIASSDLGYILKSNFPFYTEQVDSRAGPSHLTEPGSEGDPSKPKEVKTGAVHGRTYAKDMDRPDFIHPSPEPLQVSMEKQKQLKEEIRALVHLAISTIQSGKMASAESKGFDQRSLEAGLAYIGLILEHGENEVARYFSNYEKTDPAFVKYPLRYTLKSEEDRAKETKSCAEQMDMIPSLAFKKQMAKRIVEINLGSRVPLTVIDEINREIDKAEAFIGDPMLLIQDIINGIVGPETAAAIRCYPKGEAERAAAHQVDKLTRVAMAQAAANPMARGVDSSNKDTAMMDRTDMNGPKQMRGKSK